MLNSPVDSLVEVQCLTFKYGDRLALDDVTFSCSPGSFCALLGPNGAGKSTLIAILTGLLVPDSGSIAFAGHDLRREPGAVLAKLGIVFQQTTLDLDLTVSQNMSYFAALQGMRGYETRSRIDAALDRLGVSDRANDPVRKLNGGHRRRVEIARSLIHEPSILILDEPTVGLDPETRVGITDYVHHLARDTGLTVIWTTHLVDEVRPDDDVIVLHQGRVLAHQTASKLAARAPLSEAFLKMTGQGT